MSFTKLHLIWFLAKFLSKHLHCKCELAGMIKHQREEGEEGIQMANPSPTCGENNGDTMAI